MNDFLVPIVSTVLTVVVALAWVLTLPESWSTDIHNCTGKCYEDYSKSHPLK